MWLYCIAGEKKMVGENAGESSRSLKRISLQLRQFMLSADPRQPSSVGLKPCSASHLSKLTSLWSLE